MNKDDSERISGMLTAAGHTTVAREDDADLIVFNTCCIRQNADDRLYGQASSLKQLKNARPGTIIAIGGCLAQMDRADVQKKLPHVDIVFGTHNVSDLPQMIDKIINDGRKVCEISDDSAGFTGDLPATRLHPRHSWLPIMVGCDNFCAYCIVPYVRGREKSRSLESLLAQGRKLVREGVREITLLGQNVNSYGRDLYGKPEFTQLLGEMATIEGLERIRFTTSHPKDLGDDLIDLVGSTPNLCPHFHLPLQSGSSRILKLMKRKYTAEEYLKIVAKIKAKVGGVSITTDIMVAFPGETEDDFNETLSVVRQAEFDQAFTFIYSPRRGTAASRFKDRIPAEVAGDRFARLVAAQNENAIKRNRYLVGARLPVFVEGISKKSKFRLAGRTPSNKLVHFNGGDELIGQTLDVEITQAFSWFLIGETAR